MDIFWSLQSRQCKDDRDRVYAALGFLPWDIPLKLQPDYSKSVCHVYVEFAKAMLDLHYLEVLLYAGLWDRVSEGTDTDTGQVIGNKNDSCPSWVPELRPSRLRTRVMIAWDHPMLDEPIKTIETPSILWPNAPVSESESTTGANSRLSPDRVYIQSVVFDKIIRGR